MLLHDSIDWNHLAHLFLFHLFLHFIFTVPSHSSHCTIKGVGYPADIIKTRIQATEPHVVKGIFETGLELIAEANGNVFQGLYRGFGLKLVRSIPASMIGFTTYEFAAYQLRS
jgi:hypothetical protein